MTDTSADAPRITRWEQRMVRALQEELEARDTDGLLELAGRACRRRAEPVDRIAMRETHEAGMWLERAALLARGLAPAYGDKAEG